METVARLVGKAALRRGIEILIKSVIQDISTYSMTVFKLTRGLCQHIASLIKKFQRGIKKGKMGTAWVSWDEMAMQK